MESFMLLVYSALLVFFLSRCASAKHQKSKTYLIKKISLKTEEISNILEDSIWNKAILLEEFSQPWSSLYLQKTSFRGLYNEQFLFLRYDVEDRNVLVFEGLKNKLSVTQSDRVEVFFRKNQRMAPYYCLEIDPNGKLLDYSATFYRKFNNDWAWPQGHILTTGKNYLDGYRVYVTISLQSLRELGILKKNRIEAGIYRGDCKTLPSKNRKDSEIKWISWVDPKTDNPDFHVPSSFGILKLE